MNEFVCCRCHNSLPRSAFGGITKRNDYCFECSRKINREYSSKNREKRNEQNRRAAAKRYRINRDNLIVYLKDKNCVDCKEPDAIVLEFDHIDPSLKRAQIGNVLGSWNWNTILTEIEKCEIRCANCHRRRTAKQFGWFNKGGDAQ
jgi:hypothetical protein